MEEMCQLYFFPIDITLFCFIFFGPVCSWCSFVFVFATRHAFYFLHDFSHVLHKNAAVVQAGLSLLHFFFLLNFGAWIPCVVSIAWSPFFWSACHPWDIIHLLHLLILLFLNSCEIFFLDVLCTSSLGYNYNSSLSAKKWGALVLIVRLIHHHHGKRPTLTMIRIFHLFQSSVSLGKCRPNAESTMPSHL